MLNLYLFVFFGQVFLHVDPSSILGSKGFTKPWSFFFPCLICCVAETHKFFSDLEPTIT